MQEMLQGQGEQRAVPTSCRNRTGQRSQPRGWGLLQCWLQRQSVPGCVTWARGNQEACWYGEQSAGLRGGTSCVWVLVSGSIQHGLLLSYTCKALPNHLCSISGILERMRYLLGLLGELTCTGLVKRHWRGSLTLSSASTAAFFSIWALLGLSRTASCGVAP